MTLLKITLCLAMFVATESQLVPNVNLVKMPHTLAELNGYIAAAAFNQLVVIDFFVLDGCDLCKAIAPDFEEMARVETSVAFLKVDIAANRMAAKAFNVQDPREMFDFEPTPTFAFVKNGIRFPNLVSADKSMLQKRINRIK